MSFMFLDLLGVIGVPNGGGGDIILSTSPTPINIIEIDDMTEDFVVDMSAMEDERMLTIYLQPQEYTFVLKEQDQP